MSVLQKRYNYISRQWVTQISKKENTILSQIINFKILFVVSMPQAQYILFIKGLLLVLQLYSYLTTNTVSKYSPFSSHSTLKINLQNNTILTSGRHNLRAGKKYYRHLLLSVIEYQNALIMNKVLLFFETYVFKMRHKLQNCIEFEKLLLKYGLVLLFLLAIVRARL